MQQFLHRGRNATSHGTVLLPPIPTLQLISAALGRKIEHDLPVDITVHCPGLGAGLNLGEYDIVIANKGALSAYGPTGALRDEEVFADGTRNTKVAYAPTQIGQAMKAMFRDTPFRNMWRTLLMAQHFRSGS